jgi:hypothetical protein
MDSIDESSDRMKLEIRPDHIPVPHHVSRSSSQLCLRPLFAIHLPLIASLLTPTYPFAVVVRKCKHFDHVARRLTRGRIPTRRQGLQNAFRGID